MAEIAEFGTGQDGSLVHAITLKNGALEATVLTHGARLHSLRHAGSPNLTQGAETLAAYEGTALYSNAVVAPVVNRIAGAEVPLGRELLLLEANEGPNCLHSGFSGTQALTWQVEKATNGLAKLTIALPDGHGGFPGARTIRAIFALDTAHSLRITLEAESDARTLFNPAFHGGWNLDGSGVLDGHRLTVMADQYLPVTSDTLPTGEIADVEGTPFDYRRPRAPDPRLDHNFCLARSPRSLAPVARLTGASGRELTVQTTAPGLQVYCGSGAGVALEPQIWPDAPHHKGFPSIIAQAGDVFRQESLYTFGP
ncbi:MAG: aldose epimerase family protein [Pseudomonadota bacterium]